MGDDVSRLRSIMSRALLHALLLFVAAALAPAVLAAQRDSLGTIAGVVTDSAGAALAGAEVHVGQDGVWSGANGRFHLAGLRAGNAELRIRRLGFCPDTIAVTVPAGATATITVPLARCAPTLAPVVVRASQRKYVGRLAGFNERRDRGIGRFITRADIERLHPAHISDVIRTLPGVSIVVRDNSTANGPARPDRRAEMEGRAPSPTVADVTTRARIRLRGASCAPNVYLNGARLSTDPEVDIDSFTPQMLEGIEIYAGSAGIPPQFSAPGSEAGSRCGAVVLWTTVGERHEPGVPRPERAAELVRLVESAQVYLPAEVDERAVLDAAHSPLPIWDDSVRAVGSGRVVVELVVDAGGDPELATLNIVSATHPALINPVRRALAQSKFRPAKRGGRAVRQLVQQPFEFVAEAPAPR
jgi:carboxypeptidase family protein/TonB-dependent receptor-like protein/TonB-like protein